MKQDLREICHREIERINDLSKNKPLEKEEIEKLKSLATALKTLEDSKAPESDNVANALKVASVDDILKVLDETEGE